MDTKHSKSECVKEKEKENTIENHRLARSKEKEVKKQLGSIARENGHKEEEISAYNEQEKKTIDKRLSEGEKIKRSANETIYGSELETEQVYEAYETCSISMGSRINLWDAKEEDPTLPHFLVLSDYIPPPAPPPPDLLDGLYPDDQQQQNNYYTPSDIENDVLYEDLPPNPIIAQHENPAPPPPDYLE